MKKRFRRLAAGLIGGLLALSCLACTGTDGENPGENPNPASASSADTRGQEDREVLHDYQTITIGGEHDCTMLFVNAGKADSIVVKVDGKAYLIDAGTAASPPMIYAALSWLEVEALDGVFLTHTHNDHVGGYRTVAECYPIEVCYTAAITADWGKLDAIIEDTPRIALDPGSVVEIAEGAYFEVLGPIRYNPIDDNNNSLVLRLTVNGVTTIFAGDMLFDEEKTLMRAGMDLRCDLLKLGHHGKKDATSTSLMQEAMPDYAVICTDREDDSATAHKSVVNALKGMDAEVFVTDEYDLGLAVTIEKDGTLRFENAEPREKNPKVKLESVSKADQSVVLHNKEGAEVDVSEWFLVSETGKELFRFPDGTVIPADGRLTVACMGSKVPADLTWKDGTVWHKTKEDNAVLIDHLGNLVDEKASE